MKKIFKYLIKFYQKYLTILAFGSCRYYPSCSNYAQWQFDNNTFFKAIYFTMLRILKCNQLFDGGIDYPVVNFKSLDNLKYKKIKVIYWFVPTKNGKYFVVKNREWNNNNESSQQQ